MFRLPFGKKLFRLSAIGLVVVAVMALTGSFVAMRAKQEINAATVGGTAVVGFNEDQSTWIPYGSGPASSGPEAGSITPRFYIESESNTYNGYCMQPHVRPMAGSYEISTIPANEYEDEIKFIMYVNEVDNYYTRQIRNDIFNNWRTSDSDGRYAWTHAVISMLTPINTNIYGEDFYNTTYHGSNWGLSGDDIAFAEGIIGKLQYYISNNNAAWLLANRANVYYADAGANHGADGYRHQNVAWLEVPSEQGGSIQIQKCDSDTTEPNCLVSGRDVSGIKFALYNNTGSWIYLDTYDEFVSGTWNPNASDNSAARIRFNNPDGPAAELVTGADGRVLIQNLVPGNYVLVEIETNDEYELTAVAPRNVTVTANHTTPVRVNNDYIVTTEYSITTKAYDGAGSDVNDKYIEAKNNATIKDNVTYCGEANTTYQIYGEVINKSTGTKIAELAAPISVTTGTNGCGTTTVTYTLNANRLGGLDLVVYEYLKDGDDLLASHTDPNDQGQTVTVISLGTTAVDDKDGDKYVDSTGNVTIKDTISYCLKPGKTYTIKGVLMDKNTNTPSIINGAKVEGSITITPITACGTTTMTFGFDASGLAGKEVVVFESVYEGSTLILEHTDINDDGQTVDVIKLGTVAQDAADGDKYLDGSDEVTIVDQVDYCLKVLSPSDTASYTLKGILMDKRTKNPLLVNGETVESTVELRPQQKCGTVEMRFTFDASGLGGKDVVIFESAYYYDVKIVSHEDINDEDQLVEIISISTVAVDKLDGDKEILANEDAVVSDTIKYCLRANRDYTILSTILDKDTGEPVVFDENGESLIVTTELTPKEDCGEIVVDYPFDATGLAGHTLVMVAKVQYDGEEILIHANLDDANQAIKVIAPEVPDTGFITGRAQGGDEQSSPIIVSFIAVSALLISFAGARIIRRRHILR